MESALNGFFIALDDCQSLCYKMPSYQVDRFPQFWRSVAEFEHTTLKCKLDCTKRVYAEDFHEKVENPVELMLNYLQFCYYHTGETLLAANSAKTLQLINPKDDEVNSNVDFYMKKVKEMGLKDFQGNRFIFYFTIDVDILVCSCFTQLTLLKVFRNELDAKFVTVKMLCGICIRNVRWKT